MSQPDPPPAGRLGSAYPWYVVGVLTLAYMLAFIDRQILSLLVQPIRRDLGISDTGVSLLGGFAFAIFYSLLGLPLGRLADTMSRRRLIAVGVALWSLMTLCCGLARGFWLLFLARVGVGVGEAALSPAAYSLISDYFPPEKLGRAVGVYVMATSLGAGGALILGGAVVGLVSHSGPIDLGVLGVVRPWQIAFLVVGAPGLAVAALMSTVREPMRRGLIRTAGEATVSVRQALAFLAERRATYAPLIAGYSILGMFGYATLAWAPSLFIRRFGWSPSEAGYWLGALMLVCGTAGILAGGALTDRLRQAGMTDAYVRIPILASLPMIPASLAWALVPDPRLALALLGVAIFCMFVPAAAGPAAIQAVTPNQMRGLITSVYSLIGNLVGIALGPTVVALVTDYVFHDDKAVGRSLAVVGAIAIPIGAGVLALGLRGFRDQMAAAQAWNGAV